MMFQYYWKPVYSSTVIDLYIGYQHFTMVNPSRQSDDSSLFAPKYGGPSEWLGKNSYCRITEAEKTLIQSVIWLALTTAGFMHNLLY